MDFTATIQNIARGLKGGYLITLETSSDVGSLAEYDLFDVKIKKHTEKRSLNANGLMWSCLQKIANVLRADKWDIYLKMLKRYGQYTYICVKPEAVDGVKRQWRECEELGEIDINGQKAIQLLCYYGSSTYNTQEFSVLLDGIFSEMRELNIPTPEEEELERALEKWEKENQ